MFILTGTMQGSEAMNIIWSIDVIVIEGDTRSSDPSFVLQSTSIVQFRPSILQIPGSEVADFDLPLENPTQCLFRVPAVVHVGAPEHSLDLCVPYTPPLLIRQQDEVDQTHDLLEQKALDHVDEHRSRQVEEVGLRRRALARCGVACGLFHGELSGRVLVEEQSLVFLFSSEDFHSSKARQCGAA